MNERPTSGRRPEQQFEMQNELSSITPRPDIRSLPFEERAEMFTILVQGVGIGIGGDAEYDLRQIGRIVIAVHNAATDEDRNRLEREYSDVMDRLGTVAQHRSEVGEAILNVTLAEVSLF